MHCAVGERPSGRSKRAGGGEGTLFQYRRGGRGRQGFVMNLKPEIRAWVQ